MSTKLYNNILQNFTSPYNSYAQQMFSNDMIHNNNFVKLNFKKAKTLNEDFVDILLNKANYVKSKSENKNKSKSNKKSAKKRNKENKNNSKKLKIKPKKSVKIKSNNDNKNGNKNNSKKKLRFKI